MQVQKKKRVVVVGVFWGQENLAEVLYTAEKKLSRGEEINLARHLVVVVWGSFYTTMSSLIGVL